MTFSTARRSRFSSVLLFALAVCLLAGCRGRPLMPTPNAVLSGRLQPFFNLPEELQTERFSLVYATDRVPVGPASHPQTYSARRSPNLVVGTVQIRLWNQGEKGSTDWAVAQYWESNPRIAIEGLTPHISYPGTPWQSLTIPDPSPDELAYQARLNQTGQELCDLLAGYENVGSGEDVYVFVHGYNSSLEKAARVVAEFWHYGGRAGIPIVYSWPANGGGLITGYDTDRESAEFTIFHLKQFLKDVAACPTVRRVHLVAHSRGANPVLDALRELDIELRGAGQITADALKLENLILASPDIDSQVMDQRIVAEGTLDAARHVTIYIANRDLALATSRWLHGSVSRLGLFDVDLMSYEALQALLQFGNVDIIDCRILRPGDFLMHSYFRANPAVSSDLLLTLRRRNRPLQQLRSNIWRIQDEYALSSRYEALLAEQEPPPVVPATNSATLSQQPSGAGNVESGNAEAIEDLPLPEQVLDLAPGESPDL